jgi:hypothetical protein
LAVKLMKTTCKSTYDVVGHSQGLQHAMKLPHISVWESNDVAAL